MRCGSRTRRGNSVPRVCMRVNAPRLPKLCPRPAPALPPGDGAFGRRHADRGAHKTPIIRALALCVRGVSTSARLASECARPPPRALIARPRGPNGARNLAVIQLRRAGVGLVAQSRSRALQRAFGRCRHALPTLCEPGKEFPHVPRHDRTLSPRSGFLGRADAAGGRPAGVERGGADRRVPGDLGWPRCSPARRPTKRSSRSRSAPERATVLRLQPGRYRAPS